MVFLNPPTGVHRMCQMKYQRTTRRQNLLLDGIVVHTSAVAVVYAQKAASAPYPSCGRLAAWLNPRDNGWKSARPHHSHSYQSRIGDLRPIRNISILGFTASAAEQ